jgi:hypothetical protein
MEPKKKTSSLTDIKQKKKVKLNSDTNSQIEKPQDIIQEERSDKINKESSEKPALSDK